MTLRLKPADLLFVKTIPNDGDEFVAAKPGVYRRL